MYVIETSNIPDEITIIGLTNNNNKIINNTEVDSLNKFIK